MEGAAGDERERQHQGRKVDPLLRLQHRRAAELGARCSQAARALRRPPRLCQRAARRRSSGRHCAAQSFVWLEPVPADHHRRAHAQGAAAHVAEQACVRTAPTARAAASARSPGGSNPPSCSSAFRARCMFSPRPDTRSDRSSPLSLNAGLLASFCRPTPGSAHPNADSLHQAKPKDDTSSPWPLELPSPGKEENEEQKKMLEESEKNFALVVVEPYKVDLVNLADDTRTVYELQPGDVMVNVAVSMYDAAWAERDEGAAGMQGNAQTRDWPYAAHFTADDQPPLF
ncbi:hypothetical protein L1887_55104 [Cichorium endivia]|nr:hypothetical protein L1887_55104 [Cichorium endivia]